MREVTEAVVAAANGMVDGVEIGTGAAAVAAAAAAAAAAGAECRERTTTRTRMKRRKSMQRTVAAAATRAAWVRMRQSKKKRQRWGRQQAMRRTRHCSKAQRAAEGRRICSVQFDCRYQTRRTTRNQQRHHHRHDGCVEDGHPKWECFAQTAEQTTKTTTRTAWTRTKIRRVRFEPIASRHNLLEPRSIFSVSPLPHHQHYHRYHHRYHHHRHRHCHVSCVHWHDARMPAATAKAANARSTARAVWSAIARAAAAMRMAAR